MVVEIKQLKDMGLAELIERMITANLSYHKSIDILDGRGSPYASEEKLKESLLKEYNAIVGPLKEELARREKIYSRS